ncbi:hypothetical protein BH24ACT15_BH24ACT15_12640 [soil metagenome]
MNKTFRRRVFTPLVMPLAVLGGILVFALSLSRILLAVPEALSVLIAVLAAGYVLAVAFVVERRHSITSSALAVGLTIGVLGLVGAGGVAASVGMRELHEEGEEEGAEGDGAVAEIPEGALVWETSQELAFVSAPSSGAAGEVTVAIENSAGLEHNVVIEGVQGDAPLVQAANGIDAATVTIEPGDYTYYCNIPGHRSAGMEGQITFE